jgi:adenylate cyclase
MTEDGVKRKLRAILSADVKGYSRMMGADEIGTYKVLASNLKSINSIISKHDGRVFSSPGDAVMAEFSSVVDAVQCAVELQEKIEAANAEVPDDRKMQFRIGVNLGDVIHDGEQVYGDGVNVAARIETLAEPGKVAISKNVYRNVRNKVKFGYEYTGEHQVKNIAEPVRVYKVLTAPEQAGLLIGEPETPKRASKQSYITIFAILAIVAAAAFWHCAWCLP